MKSGIPPTNLPEISELREVLLKAREKKMEIRWKWVKGHDGVYGNEMADRLANKGAEIKKSEIDNGTAEQTLDRPENLQRAEETLDPTKVRMEIPKLAVTTLEEAKVLQLEQEAEIEDIINLLIKDSVYRVEMRDKIKMVNTATQVTYCPKALKKADLFIKMRTSYFD